MKSTEILHVFGPQFFGESIYKTDTGSDHVAKFRGDRPRELVDYALKKKKHHEHFISPPDTPYLRPKYDGQNISHPELTFGRPNNRYMETFSAGKISSSLSYLST